MRVLRVVSLLFLFAATTSLAFPSDPVDDVVPEMLEEEEPLYMGHNPLTLTAVEDGVLFKSAQKHVQYMLTQGADPKACQQLAKDSMKDVKLQVEQFQKELDIEVGLLGHCQNTDADVVSDAIKLHKEAEKHFQAEKKKLDHIHVNLGRWKYSELQKAEHNAKDAQNLLKKIFDHRNYTAAKVEYNKRQPGIDKHQGALDAAKKNLESTKSVRKASIHKCICNAKARITKVYNIITASTTVGSQTKAYRKAELILCSVKGQGEANCKKGKMPQVKMPPFPASAKKVTCSK